MAAASMHAEDGGPDADAWHRETVSTALQFNALCIRREVAA